jgi:hypothetical protein
MARKRPGSIRSLTPGETALAAEMFGDALNPARVRIWGWPKPWSRAFVPGRWFWRDWIIFPASEARADFTKAGVCEQAAFVHELTHIQQAQAGVNLLFAKLWAGDSRASYAYHLKGVRPWAKLNIEQQATVVEHLFLARRGVATPWPEATLAAVCPFGAVR